MIISRAICIDYQRIIWTNAMKYAMQDKRQSIYCWTANIIEQSRENLRKKFSSKIQTSYWHCSSSRLKELQH